MHDVNPLCIAAQSSRFTSSHQVVGQRTESDWTANGIRLDGERNLIGRRTQKRGVHLSQVHRLLLLVALKSYLYCLDTRLIRSDFVRKKGVLIPLTRI